MATITMSHIAYNNSQYITVANFPVYISQGKAYFSTYAQVHLT